LPPFSLPAASRFRHAAIITPPFSFSLIFQSRQLSQLSPFQVTAFDFLRHFFIIFATSRFTLSFLSIVFHFISDAFAIVFAAKAKRQVAARGECAEVRRGARGSVARR